MSNVFASYISVRKYIKLMSLLGTSKPATVSTWCESRMRDNVGCLWQLATATPRLQTICHNLSFMSRPELDGLNQIKYKTKSLLHSG